MRPAPSWEMEFTTTHTLHIIMTKSDINKKAMIKALEKALGIVTTACKLVGISRETHYRWTREDEKYNLAVNELENMVLDFAESSLHKQIKNEVPASTIWFLKTKGKSRGYIEKQEIDLSGSVGVTWNETRNYEGEKPSE